MPNAHVYDMNGQRSTEATGVREAEELVRANADDIWRYLRRRLDSDDDADDLAAEVFAVAWRRSAHTLPAGQRRLWLFGVARNVLQAHRRSHARRLRLVTRLRPGETSVAPPDLGERDLLSRALAALPDLDREVVLLRAWEGFSVAEIADLLGVTPNAVSVRLSKARRKLAASLEADRRAECAVDVPSGPTSREMP